MYLALDFPDWQQTEQFLITNQLNEVPVKVGMELFYREGAEVIKRLRDRGHPVFLDIKLHDIPTTIYKAMKNVAKLDVELTNVHSLGGAEMIKAAKAGLLDGGAGHQTKLLAVTILTSMTGVMLREELRIDEPLADTVVHLAELSQSNGADGVVCSPLEVELIKNQVGPKFLTVTPGIRLAKDDMNEQKRIATPAKARALGADAIVIGRSITQADQPKQAYLVAEKEWTV